MKTLLRALLFTVLLLCSSLATTYGQDGDEPVVRPEFPENDLRFQHLTTEDGLSEGRVWGIIQDRRGFMWFTTWDGLNRYDGYEFKVYKEELGNPNSPGGEGFWDVYEDREGMIWAASHTGGGLSRFDPTTEQWQRYQHDPDDPHSLSSDSVYVIFEDSMGALWIGTEGGWLNRFEGEMENGQARFSRFGHNPDDPNNLGSAVVVSIYEDRSGVLWVGTYGVGLLRFDRATETFTYFQHNPDDPESVSHNLVYPIYEDQYGVLWVGTYGGGLDRFDRETETFTHYQHDPEDPHSLSGDTLTGILEDGSGTLWIGTLDGGLNRYDRDTDTFISYRHDSSDPRSLSNNSVTTLFEDESGILWIGTAGSGVDRLDPYGQTFGLMRNNPTDSNSLSHNDIRSVLEDKSGDLWIGTTSGGLNHYDPETETFTHYQHDPVNQSSLGDNWVLSLLEDKERVLWIGLDNGGLNKLDRRTEDGGANRFTRFEHGPDDPQSLSNNSVTAIYEDEAGILWVGTWSGGLNAFDHRTEGDGQARFKRYKHDPEDPHSLGGGVVWSILEDASGVLWVGTAGGGLCRFDREVETFACHVHDPEDEHSLSSNTVWVIHQDREGSLWIGTSAGLNRFSLQTGQFAHYTKADGLPHDTVVGILEDVPSSGDGLGDLWLSTLGGLSRFDTQTETFRNFDAGDGLAGNIFNPAAIRTRSGKMLFGGQQGLTSFYPQDVQENPNIPPVRVTGLSLSNEPVSIGGDSPLQHSIIETEKLELTYQDRVITFEFAVLDYASPEKNRYRYMLEGFDENWIEVGSDRRFVTYTNLNPGKYTFRVLGSNNDGVWNEEGTSISLIITPPWWETWWFRGGLLLLITGLIAVGFVWQRDSARSRERQLEAQVTERTQALTFAEEQIRTLFSTSQIGIGLIALDGQLLTSNKALQQMTGYSEKELLQRNVSDFYIDPQQWDELLIILAESVSVNNFGMKIKRQDGTLFYANLNASKIYQGGQEVILSLIDDVTERKRIGDALRESEEAYRGLVEKTSDVIYIVDKQGVTTYVNPAIESLIGLPPDQVVGQPFAQYIHAEDLGRLQDNFGNLLSGRAPGNAEYRLMSASGETRWIHVTSQPIVEEDRVTGLQGVLTDITESKRMEELHQQLVVAKERDRLALDLHDTVTQSLYSITLQSDSTLMALSAGNSKAAEKRLDILKEIAQDAMAEMRLLIYQLQPSIIEEEGLVNALEQRLELVENRSGIAVDFQVEGEPCLPLNKQIGLFQVAQEGLNNVIKHARASHLLLWLSYEPVVCRLKIEDDGVGFDLEQIGPYGGFGLKSMRSRLKEIKGRMDIVTGPGSGTILNIEVPYE